MLQICSLELTLSYCLDNDWATQVVLHNQVSCTIFICARVTKNVNICPAVLTTTVVVLTNITSESTCMATNQQMEIVSWFKNIKSKVCKCNKIRLIIFRNMFYRSIRLHTGTITHLFLLYFSLILDHSWIVLPLSLSWGKVTWNALNKLQSISEYSLSALNYTCRTIFSMPNSQRYRTLILNEFLRIKDLWKGM